MTQPETLRLIAATDSKNEIILRVDAERASAELQKLYELNTVLLQKCHVLEKMVNYKVDHIFDDKTPLTSEKIREIWIEYGSEGDDAEGFARALEKAHGIS